MTTEAITLSDAWGVVRQTTGSAPPLLVQAKRCLAEFDKQKDALPAELGELVSIERIDPDLGEITLTVHRQRVVGRFSHALTAEGYLLGQFAFARVQRDDSEQPLWAFTFTARGETLGITEERRDESGICDVLVRDVLVHLIARVQGLLPRAG
jgi:hypothetical protein